MSGRLVDFVIGGAQKCGTTALWKALSEHPQICMSRQKEVHFFDQDRFFTSNDVAYDEYHKHFLLTPDHRRIGEATPIYLFWRPCAGRIVEYNPAMRWILLLRNPVDRAYSHFMMSRALGSTNLSLEEVIEKEQKLLPGVQDRVYSCLSRGMYSEQLERLFALFPKEQVLVLKSDDLRHDQNVLPRIFNFLEVDAYPGATVQEIHRGNYEEITEESRRRLSQYFVHELEKLEVLLQWNLSDWKL
ncbi:MAG: sulfotransferase domain-containing protein [Bdellovibrionota bacterium]